MLAEQTEWKDSCFLTLTYDEDHVPRTRHEAGTFIKYTTEDVQLDDIDNLRKQDLQKYFKRLRRGKWIDQVGLPGGVWMRKVPPPRS